MFFDLLIINADLMTLTGGDTTVARDCFIGVKADKIAATGPMANLSGELEARQLIDASDCLVMPGLVNAHTHGAMTLLRGLADDLPLMTWLHEHIFPAEARSVNPEMVYWCSKLAAAELIMSGTTTVADGYFHEHDAACALFDAGIRAVAAQGVIDFPAPGVPDPEKNVATAAKFMDAWGNNELITPAVFCHSPYTCSPGTLKKAKAAADAHNALFFIHVAETADEVEQVRELYGDTPIRYLYKLGVLDERTVSIHTVWVDEAEIDILGQSGAGVVHCPESNMKLAAGVSPVPRMLAAGIPVSLGTDGCASNNNLDLFQEMDSCAKLHKIHNQDPTVLTAAQALAMATVNGARTLHMDHKAGTIEAQKNADLILIDMNKPHLTPRHNLDSLLTYSATGADVKSVIINGRLVMRDRRILSFDLEETLQKVMELSAEFDGI